MTSICISASGMATPLAPNLLDSCAAAHAGITRMSELKIVSLSECESLGQTPIAACPARYIAPGFIGFAKALLLATAAMADLQSRISLSHDGLRRTGIFINASDHYFTDSNSGSWLEDDPRLPSTAWAEHCKELIPSLLRAVSLENFPQNHRLYFGGHTGFAQAIQEASRQLSAGHFDRCVVGGVDSCIEPRFLSAAASKRVLMTSANPVGFVPGEASAFVLIERVADAGRRRAETVVLLTAASFVSNGRDRLSDDAPDGVALAQAIDQSLAVSQLAGEPIASIIGDLNGDDYRARDWGAALLRLRAKYNLADVPVWIPALAFGETGAASAPVGLCLGIVAQERGWIPFGPVVQWLSADKGSRAALCFSSSRSPHQR
jgi:3-oxoacyl-[acyl-carrier-protein] synthase I